MHALHNNTYIIHSHAHMFVNAFALVYANAHTHTQATRSSPRSRLPSASEGSAKPYQLGPRPLGG
jgi:hypothetical protein